MKDDELFTPSRFANAIERIAQRRRASPSVTSLQESGVSFATIHEKRHTVARLLVKDLRASRLDPTPGRIYHIEKDGKRRRLFDFPVVELIIHDAVAEWLGAKAATVFSSRLYSYQPGISYRHALRDFAHYIRVTSRMHSTAGDRGLYVLRRDVRAYFDTIPVHEGAPLWEVLARLVGPPSTANLVWTLLHRTLRPLLIDAQGTLYRLVRGIPTGSPVANVVANLYLNAMDDQLSRVDGAFYARYGDDVVAAHPDADTAATLTSLLGAHLEPRGLEFSATKMRDLYLTTAGRPAPAGINVQPATTVEFLGHRISAHGTISLSVSKTRTLLKDLQTRATNAARASVAEPAMRLASAVRAVNRLFDPRGPAAHPYANLLRTTVTDRSYLDWLDHEVALIVVGAALGERSARHFRRFPPRSLRAQFGLHSLVAMRNHMGRG